LAVLKKIYHSCSCAFHVYIDIGGMKRESRSVMRIGEDTGSPHMVESYLKGNAYYRFKVSLPPDVGPGLYGITVRKGSNSDSSPASLVLVEQFPRNYRFIHATGALDDLSPTASANAGIDTLSQLASAAEKLGASFAILSGKFPDGMTIPGYRNFLTILGEWKVPVILNYSNGKEPSIPAERFFGPADFVVLFGEQVYAFSDSTAEEIPPVWIDDIAPPEGSERFEAIITAVGTASGNNLLSLVKGWEPEILMHYQDEGATGEASGDRPVSIGTPSLSSGYYRVIDIKDSTYSGNELRTVSTAAPEGG